LLCSLFLQEKTQIHSNSIAGNVFIFIIYD
jgi:hypothetical protein